MKRALVAGIVILSLIYAYGCVYKPAVQILDEQIVILVSMDGFRADYLDLYPTPNISHIMDAGVRATSLIPSHPTKTFPNHYTLVTGLYPANHGIVANVMYDPVFKQTFSMSKRDEVENARWWEGEPLWVTAEKQGVLSATYFWPGSEAPIQDTRPTYWKRYDGSVPGYDRVDEVLSWLDLEVTARPRFITLYFSDVDSKGHNYGPQSDEVVDAIKQVDEYIGRLSRGIEMRGLEDKVNLILVSDHGMAATDKNKLIFLDDYVNEEDFYLIDTTPMLMLNAREGRIDTVHGQLKNAHPALKVYLDSEYPASWHWKGHRRIPEMVAIADEGWTIISNRDDYEQGRKKISQGAHGYDLNLLSMHSIFVASGPAFVQGEQVDAFENIHIYPLIAHILRLKPAEVDGSLDKVLHLLKNE